MVIAKVGSAPVEAVPCVQKVKFDVKLLAVLLCDLMTAQ